MDLNMIYLLNISLACIANTCFNGLTTNAIIFQKGLKIHTWEIGKVVNFFVGDSRPDP